jgi:hypothetical protein
MTIVQASLRAKGGRFASRPTQAAAARKNGNEKISRSASRVIGSTT